MGFDDTKEFQMNEDFHKELDLPTFEEAMASYDDVTTEELEQFVEQVTPMQDFKDGVESFCSMTDADRDVDGPEIDIPDESLELKEWHAELNKQVYYMYGYYTYVFEKDRINKCLKYIKSSIVLNDVRHNLTYHPITILQPDELEKRFKSEEKLLSELHKSEDHMYVSDIRDWRTDELMYVHSYINGRHRIYLQETADMARLRVSDVYDASGVKLKFSNNQIASHWKEMWVSMNLGFMQPADVFCIVVALQRSGVLDKAMYLVDMSNDIEVNIDKVFRSSFKDNRIDYARMTLKTRNIAGSGEISYTLSGISKVYDEVPEEYVYESVFYDIPPDPRAEEYRNKQ